MNPLNTIEIQSMLNEAKTLNELSKEITKPYVNNNIRDYALGVMKKHDEIIKDLVKILNDNRYIFGENVDVNASYHKLDSIYINQKNLTVLFRMTDPRKHVVKAYETFRSTLTTPSSNLTVSNVFWRTVDTNDPDYDICYKWGFHNHQTAPYTKSNIALKKFTEEEWKVIYGFAKATERYTDRLTEIFKEFVKFRVGLLRNSVDKVLKDKAQNASVATNPPNEIKISIVIEKK